ncbi:cytochrome P450 [Imleria badia]|nr:cytochrome P450 [Imleria badia]
MDFSLTVFLVVLAAFVLVFLWPSRRRVPAGYPLPPGPSPFPIVGNVLGINPAEPWASYTRWGKIYGDLVYTRLLNQEVIVINSEEVAKDLLERRSSNYSDRPAIIRMTNDFFGWSFNSVMVPYNDRWRLHRRLFHQAFRPEAALNYHPVQLQKARDLILNLLETPENYIAHVQTHSTSVIMAVVYGYDIARRDDPIVNVVDRAVNLAVTSIRPEVAAFLGFFPFRKSSSVVDVVATSVRYIPTWFPGASFKRSAVLSQKYAVDMVEMPFHFVQESLAAGTAVPSMVSDSLNRIKGQRATEEYVRAIKESSVTAFADSEGCSADPTYNRFLMDAFQTASTVLIFILAMLLNPDVQTRAQAEIDSVVGTARLPDFEDRPSLPYIDAVLRETLRWRPAVPLGIPHATTSADVYDGYFIPQGATIIMNIWAMTHNDAKYAHPERFQPERFLLENGDLNDDTVGYAFGAGRRICVGRHVADASVWSAIVTILAVFRVIPCKDERGDDVRVEPRWTAGITSHPLHFPCTFVPRSSGLTAEKLGQIF